MADYNTVPITSRAELLVNVGDGNIMLVNADPNNTVWLGDDLGATSVQARTIPLGPGATIVVDGTKPVYAVCASGQTANVYVVPGGLNFFQLVEIIVKTLLIEASAGNGLFVYSGVPPAIGNLIAEITAPGTTSDPSGNIVPSTGVFNVGRWDNTGALKEHFGINNAGIVFIVGPDGVTRIRIDNGSGGTAPDVKFFNDFGAVLLDIDPNAGGQFQYQDLGSATQGPLIGAQSSKNTTDPINGGTINAGILVSDPVFGDFMTVVGATIGMGVPVLTRTAQIKPQQAASNSAGPNIRIDAPEQTTAKHLQTLLLGASPDGTRASQQVIAEVAGGALLTPQTIETFEVQGTMAAKLLKAIVAGVEETWHTPTFLNSFSAGGTSPRFQFEAIGGGRVRLSGDVNTGAVNVANIAMFNLPAGYRPARQLQFATPNNITAYTLGQPSVQVTTGGDVQLVPASTAGKFVVLDGISFELD